MTFVRATILLLLLAPVVACRTTTRTDVSALASRGAATGERLAAFYDGLARDTVDTWELTAFRRGFVSLPSSDVDSRKEFEKQHTALRSRARLARRLGNVYEALGRSADYDAGAAIAKELHALDDELRGIVDTPLGEPRTRDIVDRLIGAIATWKQDRDLASGAALLEPIAEGVQELFRSERELYRDIARDRADKYRQVATELVDAKAVVSTALVDRVLGAYELSWPDSKAPFEDERAIAGIREIIAARARSFSVDHDAELEAVARALGALVQAHTVSR
ncbi:MAG: hypothetical protein ACXW2P_13405 [Thermoanaerobaculia bacterium]